MRWWLVVMVASCCLLSEMKEKGDRYAHPSVLVTYHHGDGVGPKLLVVRGEGVALGLG